MSGFATATAQELIQHFLSTILGAGAMTPPPQIYVALSTTVPAKDGTNITEPVAMGYARQLVTGWEVVTAPLRFRNTASIPFPAPTGNWGTVLCAVAMSAVSGGTYLGHFDLNGGAGYAIPSGGAPFTIAAQGLVADCSGI